MHTISIVEIDFEGQIHPQKQLSFDFIPRPDEKVILNNSQEIPQVFKVLDVHHVPNKGTVIYLTHDNTLKSVQTSLIQQAGL